MSDAGEQDDKTEQPTEKKLREAAEQGDLPTSREAPLFGFLAASLLCCSLMLRDSAQKLIETLIRLFDNSGGWPLRNGADAAVLVHAIMDAAAGFLAPIAILFIVTGLTVSFAQHMPRVVLSRIAPKISKLSPAAGLARLFGGKGFIEFAKGVAKLLIVGLIVTLIMRTQSDIVFDALFIEPIGIPDTMLGIVIRLLSGVATAFVLLTVVDFIWSRSTWAKRMRMTRKEIKDEMRQSEGDPLLKAKRRSLALDRSRRRMMKAVPQATMVIANPTHYAIALRYVREEMSAPLVVAKGQDLIALKIREIAEQNNISIIEDKLLARSMYDHVEVSKVIPPQFYKAIAEIVHFLNARKNAKASSERTRVLR